MSRVPLVQRKAGRRSKSPVLPRRYILLRAKLTSAFHRARASASKLVPQMYDSLIQTGYTPKDAGNQIVSDLSPPWSIKTIKDLLPKAAKDSQRVEWGHRGAKFKNEYKERDQSAHFLESEIKIDIDLAKWKPVILQEIKKAEESGSNQLIQYIDRHFKLRNIKAAEVLRKRSGLFTTATN
jgi:hypothetical protein